MLVDISVSSVSNIPLVMKDKSSYPAKLLGWTPALFKPSYGLSPDVPSATTSFNLMLFSPSTSIVESSVKGKASISASNEISPAKRTDSSASNSLTTSENESIEVKSVLAMIEDTSLDNTVAIEPSASVAL